MQTIFLSPHFDDVALSCGGLVWQETQAGKKVSIWTICAGEIPAGPLSAFAQKLHQRWQTGEQAVAQRRDEDIVSCKILGADYRHFDIPDCIYRFQENITVIDNQAAMQRQHLYSEETFLGELHPADDHLVEMLSNILQQNLSKQAQIICPLSLGGHVDHRLARKMAEQIGRKLKYYADYPYSVQHPQEVAQLELAGWQKSIYPISALGLQAWQESVAAHRSQISTFWKDTDDMRQAIADYEFQNGGVVLWQPPGAFKHSLADLSGQFY